MIVDDWAICAEAYVKKNIIMNEFFKMVRPQGNDEDNEDDTSINPSENSQDTRKRLKMESVC